VDWLLTTMKPTTRSKYEADLTRMANLSGYVENLAREDFDFVDELPEYDDPTAWTNDGIIAKCIHTGVIRDAVINKMCVCTVHL
jgi:hypothetical protein